MGGERNDYGYGIAADSAGNVYATGFFYDTADFDPGEGTFNLTSTGYSSDIFVQKLDARGTLVWARGMGGTGTDEGNDIAVDRAGNVYTTGFFPGTADFDPGEETFNLTGAGGSDDIFAQKLDARGNLVWARSMGGTGYDSSNGSAVDGAGNLYTTGTFQGTADFDPGTGTMDLTSAGKNDIFVQKLDASGTLVWARSMGGNGYGGSNGIAVDGAGNVHTTGFFRETVDFDPGEGTFDITSAGYSSDIFVQKLDASGNLFWVRRMGWTGNDGSNGIAVDGAGNVYTTGFFQDKVDFDPGKGIFYLTSAWNSPRFFVQKLSRRERIPPNATTIAPLTTGPTNADSVSFTVNFDEAVRSFDDAADLVLVHRGTASTAASISAATLMYSVTVTGITGNGSFSLAVSTASDVQDLAGNALASSVTSAAFVIDNTAPLVEIGTPVGTPVNSANTASFPVALNESGSFNLNRGDVTLSHNGTEGGNVVVEDGATAAPTVKVRGVTGDGTYSISFSGGIATDVAGNSSEATGPSDTVLVDNTAPSVSIGAPTGSPLDGTGTVSYPVAINGADTINLIRPDVKLNHNGTAGGSVVVVNGTSESPTIEVRGVTGEGSFSISIRAGIATDAAGNSSEATAPSDAVLVVDNAAPAFTGIVANPSEAMEADAVLISFDGSEPIAGDPVVTVNGNPATRTAKAAFAYVYTVHRTDPPGPATIEIVGMDSAGNEGTLSNTTALTIKESEVEGEGEGENPPAGCNGCNANSAPMEKALGDWLAGFLGLAVLLGAHLGLRTRQEA
jgi:hypothetical protein